MSSALVRKPILASPIPDRWLTGPCFAALAPKQKKFLVAYLESGGGYGAISVAARLAGYTTSSPHTTNVVAHRHANNSRINAAAIEILEAREAELNPKPAPKPKTNRDLERKLLARVGREAPQVFREKRRNKRLSRSDAEMVS
jgi:hypothetical protein